MNKFINNFVVGIDVSSKSIVISILMPGGDSYKKNLTVNNDLKGFKKLLIILNEINEKYKSNPKIFMESTGLYHISLLNYFIKNNFECYVINPIQTKNFAKQSIRKVKNDKIDSLRIAQLAQSPSFICESSFDEQNFLLKKLCREYDSLVNNRSHYKKKLLSLLNLVFPKFDQVFSEVTGKASLELLSAYPTYADFLSASKSEVLEFITTNMNHSKKWAEEKYKSIKIIAEEAKALMLPSDFLDTEITCFVKIIKSLSESIEMMENRIKEIYTNNPVLEKNVELICTLPGIAEMSAITLLAETGDMKKFKNAKKVVAFLGLDSSVSQSGAYVGTHNKMTKRGSRLASKVLYNVALNSIKKNKNGPLMNEVLNEYYLKLCERKPKKAAICILMRKIINYIFAILRDQHPYEMRRPEEHRKLYFGESYIEAI